MGVKKTCDNCKAIDEATNPIEAVYQSVTIRGNGVTIEVSLPQNMQRGDLCRRCEEAVVSSRFADICGLIAPYRPARIPGFDQLSETRSPTQSGEDRAVLLAAVQRLLLTVGGDES